jgi:hypothetical protein
MLMFVTQNGMSEATFDEYKTKEECVASKNEALMHDNEVTKIRAFCIKLEE